MKNLTIEQQIEVLRPNLGFASHMHTWFLVGAAIGVIAAIIICNPIPLMFSIFLAIIGISEKRAGPNIVAALNAYDSLTPSFGEVSVTITQWDIDNHYHAEVYENGQSVWKYEFVPQGWQPVIKSYSARIWRNRENKRPTLVVVDDGIMIPRYDPIQIEDK